MKTFKQFITEMYVDTVKNFYGIAGDIFLNPESKELAECNDNGMIKGILVDGYDAYFFSPELLHRTVVEKLNLNPNNIVTIEIQGEYPKSKRALVFITSTNTRKVQENPETIQNILNHKYLNRTFKVYMVMSSLGDLLYSEEQK